MLILSRGVGIVNGLLTLPRVYSSLVKMFLLRSSTAEELIDGTDQKVFSNYLITYQIFCVARLLRNTVLWLDQIVASSCQRIILWLPTIYYLWQQLLVIYCNSVIYFISL